ncbi:hypothetical protein LGN19_32065 [Burkholderia sp. AU30198]|uniref:hypothetical protein n=1 Tax=Burkholderia sp. AU30198 TaxID=2879627 RepID=UPI001CF3CD9C|nr:hypothetical protein [Burkholderia sp. AU30198]MCA8298436.1 hypothetical protein [Burkholderia sp. AU30198]
MGIHFSEIIDALLQFNGDGPGRLIRGEDESKPQLEDRGYDVVGGNSDFHLYEKHIYVNHGNREINSLYKLYFLGGNLVGSSVDFGPGVGLMVLLKKILGRRKFSSLRDDAHLYFSYDRKDGAIVLGKYSVIRFGRRNVRSGYAVLGVDCASVGNEKLITRGIEATMNRLDEKPLGSFRKCHPEYGKLVHLYFS